MPRRLMPWRVSPFAAGAIGPFLSWLCCFALCCTLLPFGINIYDEGSILAGAMNVLAGRWPTLDFWTIYPGGAYAWVALLFAVFPVQLIVLRLATAAILSLGPAICFAVLYRRSVGLAAAGALGLSLWTAGTHPNFGYPPPMLIWLGSLVLLSALNEPPSSARLFPLGCAAGALALLRLDFGFFAWAATAVALLVSRDVRLGRRLIRVATFGAGAGTVLLLVVASYWAKGGTVALQLLFDRLLRFAAGPFHAARDVPFPLPFADIVAGAPVGPRNVTEGLILCFYYVMIAALPIALVAAGRRASRAGDGVAMPDARFGLALFATASVIPFLGRSNVVQGWTYVSLGIVALLWTLPPRWPARLFCATVIILGGLATAREIRHDYLEPSVPLAAPRAAGIRLHQEQAWYNDVVRLAGTGRVIYSAPSTHQHVNFNDTLLYFLLQQAPPTGYYEVHPLVTDQAPVQERIVADLRQAKPDLVVLLEQTEEPNLSSRPSGVTSADDALARHCTEEARIQAYTFLRCRWE